MYAAKLALVKGLINRFVPVLLKAVPKVDPQRPVSELTQRLFSMMREAMALNPERFYADGNWPRLLDAAERSLIFIADYSPHYAGQLAQAMLLIHDLVDESRVGFPVGARGDIDWLQWAAQHRTKGFKQKV